MGVIEMPTKRDKRLFGLAELLAAELNKSKGDVQPEDIVGFMQCNVPISEDESSEEYEDMMHEHNQRTAGRGTSAIAKLRKSLGFVDGDSIISVIEKAAEVCELQKPQEAVCDSLQKKMQSLMYYLTKEAARTSYREFLEFLDINEDEYIQIKSIWKEKLGVKPYV
jgi:hypothetical protein